MWSVSDRFLEALGFPHRVVTTVTATPPGGSAVPVEIVSGRVSVDGGLGVRRKASLVLQGGVAEFEALTAPGSLIEVRHGISFGGSSELVPVFAGEVTHAEQGFGRGQIRLELADLGNWLSRCVFAEPYAPASSLSRVDAIAAVVTGARPGTVVLNTSSDTGLIGSDMVWSSGPHEVIDQLSKDGGTEAFFLPDGSFLIRDRALTTSAPVWSVRAGEGGTISSVSRTRPLDRLYNTVVVQPGATDGSQTWTQQVAQVTDSTHPRYPAKIGTVPFFHKSPTIRSAGDALYAAGLLLDQVLGTTETLSITGVANPALEANEAIRVVTPPLVSESAQVFQHFVDSFSLDLVSGGMSLGTRSQGVEVG